MTRATSKYPCVLAIAPSTDGFGFVVLKDLNTLVDWGVKWVKTDKNNESVRRAAELITLYAPNIVAMEDSSSDLSRRSLRIRELSNRIVLLAKNRSIRVILFPRSQVKWTFLTDGKGNKDDLAKVIAEEFPDELGPLVPPRRRPWTNEDHRMPIFDAAALAVMARRAITLSD